MVGGNAVDWRAYVQSHSLTDKQQKLADKICKREARITNLQRELDKIRVRGPLEEVQQNVSNQDMLFAGALQSCRHLLVLWCNFSCYHVKKRKSVCSMLLLHSIFSPQQKGLKI